MEAVKTIDIVIVAYEKELNQLDLLLKSIVRYFNFSSLGEIFVITQEDGDRYKLFLESKYRNFPIDIEFHTQEFLLGHVAYKSGWHLQQIIKLLAYKLVATDFYLVLDTKNFFVNNVDINDFLFNGKALYKRFTERNHIGLTMGEYFVKSYATFELDASSYLDKSMGPLTPFVFKRSLVEDMVKFLLEKFSKNSFTTVFMEDVKGSEFYLYCAYCHRFRYFENFHAPRNNTLFSSTLFQGHVEDGNYFNNAIEAIVDGRTKISGINKTAFAVLDIKKKSTLSNVLSEFLSSDELNAYFNFSLN